MSELPLLTLGNAAQVNRRTGLADTIRSLSADSLVDAYKGTVAAAPKRHLSKAGFFVGHDGGGGAANVNSEKVRAKAIFNSPLPLVVGSSQVRIVDYEVPLRSSLSDEGVGEIDLVGIDTDLDRLWIIELKVFDNMDTPLKALLQGLRYSAIVDASQAAITLEALGRFDADLQWPAVIAVAGDNAYSEKMIGTPKAGDWLTALKVLSGSLAERLRIDIRLLDLGDLQVEIGTDGKAHLRQAASTKEL